MNLYFKNFDYLKKVFSVHSAMSIIFILIPIALITGPFLPDLFLSLIALYFLVITFTKKLFSYYKNYFVYIFVFFYCFLLLSGILSENSTSSLISSNGPIFYFRYLFFVLGVQYLLETNPKLIKYFSSILLITILVVIMDGIIQWQTGTNLLGYQINNVNGGRVTGLFRDEQILGHFLSFVVPLSFALLLFMVKKKKNNLKLLLLFSFLILSEVFIFITNDRSAFLKIVQFTLLLIFLSNNFKLFRLISFFLSLIIISFLALNTSHSYNRYMKSTLEEVSSTKIPYMPWTPIHEEHFKLAFNFFQESPVFGNGPQFFRYKCMQNPIDGCTSHPHNYYFQTIAELGLVGVSFLFLGFLYLSFILFRQFLNVWILKKEKYYIPDHLLSLYSLTFIFLWPLIPSGSFYNNWLNVMIFLPVPFIFYFRLNINKQ